MPPASARVLPALALALLLVPAGCGERRGDAGPGPAARPHPAPDARVHRAHVPRLRCPATAVNCRDARGRVLYVEAVDPDGDGDAHLVLLSRPGITRPGVTVIDVERELRPRRLPELGDEVSATGPVYRGSYGQRQIQATRLRIARTR